MENPVKTVIRPIVSSVMYAGLCMERMKICKMKLIVSTMIPRETTRIDLEFV
jgi:hypothetical protein